MTTFCSIHRYTVLVDGGCVDCMSDVAKSNPEYLRGVVGNWRWAAAGAIFARLVGGLVSFAFLAFVAATIWKAWSR